MAPGYKPLTGAGGLQGAPNLPAEIFKPPQFQSIEDYDRAQAVLLAQELANQQNEIALQERQRIADEQATIRESIKNQYAGQEEFDPRVGLETAQRIAMQNGDYVTALNIEKTIKERSGNQPLTPSQRTLLAPMFEGGIPEGVSPSDLQLYGALQRGNVYADQVHDPLLAENRRINAILAHQRATGSQVRPPSAAQTAKIGAGDAFLAQMDDVEQTYIPYISENRGERFLANAVNPNSAAYRLSKELDLAAKQAALALEDRVTDKDYEIIQDIIQVNDLDTMETVLDKMNRLKIFVQRRNEADLNSMEGGGFNTKGLRNRPSLMIPKAGGGGSTPYAPPGSTVLGVDPTTGLAIVRK